MIDAIVYLYLLLAYFSFNVAVILTIYIEDEKITDKKMAVFALFFAMPFVICNAIKTLLGIPKKVEK